MKQLLSFFGILLSLSLHAQYYYDDVIGTREMEQLMKKYVVNRVKSVSSTGYDNRGAKANDFSEFQEVKGNTLRISTFNQLEKTVSYSVFNEKGQLISIKDSSSLMEGMTYYTYNEKGNVVEIRNVVKDAANNFNHTETHQWIYAADNQPEKMWRILKDGDEATTADSLEVRFIKDENGNIAEERTYKKNVETGYLYYYYDDQHRLLDIVRYNTRLKKLLPDIMFEYDEQGNTAQKTTTTSSLHLGYLIWRYIYNEKGLKTKEVLFNNEKKQTGKIDYTYTYGQ